MGSCWCCPAELHTGDVGGIVYDAGYAPVCESCARANTHALSGPIGPLVLTSPRDPWCAYATVSASNGRDAQGGVR